MWHLKNAPEWMEILQQKGVKYFKAIRMLMYCEKEYLSIRIMCLEKQIVLKFIDKPNFYLENLLIQWSLLHIKYICIVYSEICKILFVVSFHLLFFCKTEEEKPHIETICFTKAHESRFTFLTVCYCQSFTARKIQENREGRKYK